MYAGCWATLFREGLAGEHGLSAAHTGVHLIAAWDGSDASDAWSHPGMPPQVVTWGRSRRR